MIRFLLVLLLLFILLSVAACAGKPTGASAQVCTNRLAEAEQAFNAAEWGSSAANILNQTRAASLLSAAKIQREFGRYPNCIDKVERARYYISLLEQE